jgi:hypothetical protein
MCTSMDDQEQGEARACARAGWMMELAADRVMAIVPG